MNKNLKYFMRPEALEEKIVEAPAPDTFKGEDGEPVTMQIRVLKNKRIREINEAHRKRTVATDGRGNPLVAGGEVVWQVEKDNSRASRNIIAEALVFPDLHDKELMEFYHCYDSIDLVDMVFPSAAEFSHVNRYVMAALGLGPAIPTDKKEEDGDAKTGDDAIIDEAKN